MSAPAPSNGYFVDQKKGEVNELKQLLKNINVERDMHRKRDVIKKVIAYMTLGIDVSRLFTDMIMAIETKDIVVKKMVYLYLSNYAQKEPEIAIMCINTLRRDCDNEDPLVRGLALRSLCSLRLESILEYVEVPLKKCLSDLSSYVRKIAVMGILKLQALSPGFVDRGNYIPLLHRMLQDVDVAVVTNVIMVLEELAVDQGGIDITQEMVLNLLNRIGEFNEWGLNVILEVVVSRYVPASEDETYAVMNILDPLLRTSNSGTVLGVLKCFINLTRPFPEIQAQVYMRAKTPLLTLITGGTPEIQYSIFKHIDLLFELPAARGVFDEDFRLFFVRYNEPPHLKHLKVDLLPNVVNVSNAADIAAELGEYVTDVDAELSKRAIRAMGKIALLIPSFSSDMVQRLTEIVDLDVPYVREESIKTLVLVLRTFPALRLHVIPSLSRYLRRLENPEAKAGLIWMLGEYATEVVEAPYMLEKIIDSYEEEDSVEIKLQTLVAAMKMFFQRPPEVHFMLGRLLRSAVNDSSNQDLHDRALLYYRLLSGGNIDVAMSMFASTRDMHRFSESAQDAQGRAAVAKAFAEDMSGEIVDKIYQEFNTLAVLYGKPASHFIAEKYLLHISNLAYPHLSSNQSQLQVAAVNGGTEVTSSQVAAPRKVSVDLLDMGGDSAFSAPVVSNSSEKPALLYLRPCGSGSAHGEFSLTPASFQKMWTSLPDAFAGRLCSLNVAPNSPAQVAALVAKAQIVTMASGPLPANSPAPGYKIFFYGIEPDDLLGVSGAVYLVQMVLTLLGPGNSEISVVIKTNKESQASAGRSMADLLVHCLQELGPQIPER